ncbi:hypothetical protein D3C77_564300 [compost metagenome]
MADNLLNILFTLGVHESYLLRWAGYRYAGHYNLMLRFFKILHLVTSLCGLTVACVSKALLSTFCALQILGVKHRNKFSYEHSWQQNHLTVVLPTYEGYRLITIIDEHTSDVASIVTVNCPTQ